MKTASIFMQALENKIVDINGLNTAHVSKDGLTARDLLKLRGNKDIQEILEGIMVIMDRENASEKKILISDNDSCLEAFELLPQPKKNLARGR